MARSSVDPVRHIISFRINLEEKERLVGLAKQSGCSVSDFVRQHFSLLRGNSKEDYSRP